MTSRPMTSRPTTSRPTATARTTSTAGWDHFHRWRDGGLIERVQDALRQKVRVQEGREPTPSAAIIDSQSVASR